MAALSGTNPLISLHSMLQSYYFWMDWDKFYSKLPTVVIDGYLCYLKYIFSRRRHEDAPISYLHTMILDALYKAHPFAGSDIIS